MERIPASKEVREFEKSQEREHEVRLLEARVRRALRHHHLHLHKSRGDKQRYLLGRYYVTDRAGVMPILHHVELPALARRLHLYFDDLSLV